MKLLLFLCCFTPLVACSQEDAFLKKNGVLNKTSWNLRDSALINRLNEASADSAFTNAKKAQIYARIAYNSSKKIEFGEGEVKSLNNLVRCKIYMNDFDSAMVFADQCLTAAKRINNPKLLIIGYESVGNVHDYRGHYDLAVDYYLKAGTLANEKAPALAARPYGNIGLIYLRLNNPEKALEYQQKCEAISRKYNNDRALTSCLNNLGILKKNEEKYEEALAHYEEGLALAEATDNIKLQGSILSNISIVYFLQKDLEKGLIYFKKSIKWIRQTDSYLELAINYHNLACNYLDLNELGKASVTIDTAIAYGFRAKSFELIMESYVVLGEIEALRGNYTAAYAAMGNAYNYKDSLNIVALSNKVSSLENSYEKQRIAVSDSLEKVQIKKEFEIDQELSNEKLWRRDLLLIISVFVLVLVAIGAFLLFKSNRKVRAKNKIVEEQHKEITDSINYAQRIQSAMISNEEVWKQISPHRSIFFKPKDVVSGDFHWAHYNEEKKLAIWCVADCTGHGVPGAFMSVLGSSFLTDIIIDSNVTDPARILDLLREKVISALMNKGEDQPKDGMDIALCVWEKETNTLNFAGANNSLYLLRKREHSTQETFKRTIDKSEFSHILYEVPPNKMPIGSYGGNESSFTSVSLKLLIGDTLILSTDGYADQFGGPEGKKMKSRPFKEYLLGIQNESISEQSNLIEQHFDNWKGSQEQLDDVCVVGIRIS